MYLGPVFCVLGMGKRIMYLKCKKARLAQELTQLEDGEEVVKHELLP